MKKIVIFGLTVSSSVGNGDASTWRALLRSLASGGHSAICFEPAGPAYAAARELCAGLGFDVVLYDDWSEAAARAEMALADADVAFVTSRCPDAVAAMDLVTTRSHVLPVFL